ncbi:hypothetical protein DTO271G3_2549 [Paecilomyces variotii]|nr:hypothetical protein DTO271G3_2549 [Paecilomyces variotii]
MSSERIWQVAPGVSGINGKTQGAFSQKVVDTHHESLKTRPNQKVICDFSRRFDASYRDAFEKLQSGLIGRPSVFRSQPCELDPSAFFVEYAQLCRGIFVDCSIHDNDLALWFFGEDSVFKSAAAVGIPAVSPELRKYNNDHDNALGIVEFYGGEIAQLCCSRMMAAGQEDSSEVTGTVGKLAVNTQPAANQVNICEPTGIRREVRPRDRGPWRQTDLPYLS